MSDVPSLDITITHLQMLAPPAAPAVPAPEPDLLILHARRPTVSYYRYLYDTVGAPWLWYERRRMSDEQLAAIVQDPLVEVHVLHAGGVPAGYVELDRRKPPEVELAYFGLMPEFIGRKLGPYFLRWAIERAWSYAPSRFWLHTCTLDHPGALGVYKRAGFEPFKTEHKTIPDPREPG